MAKRRENSYQSDLVKKIERRLDEKFPNQFHKVTKQNAQLYSGIPDLAVFCGGRYAMLETKRDREASYRPNQEYYIQKVNESGGFASRIEPENEEEVLNAMEQAFTARG